MTILQQTQEVRQSPDRQMRAMLAAGWEYESSGEENGVMFIILKRGPHTMRVTGRVAWAWVQRWQMR